MTSILLAVSLLFSFTLFAEQLDYSSENGQFLTSEGVIPSGCFGRLMSKLNGDNSVASVYLNRNSLRGCITSNSPSPNGEESAITYTIVSATGNDQYNLKVCEKLLGGSMGATCDHIMVQFINRTYVTPEKTYQVLSVQKLGEWK